MVVGIDKEVYVFLCAILTGNLVYLMYSVIRVMRRLIKHTLFWISLEDVIFWLLIGVFLFARINETCMGIIRWYFVIGVLLGMVLTHYIILKITKKYIANYKKRE